MKSNEYEQMTLESYFSEPQEEEVIDTTWHEGDEVKSVISQKIYVVSEQIGNMVRVKDGQYGSLIMARSDLEKIA